MSILKVKLQYVRQECAILLIMQLISDKIMIVYILIIKPHESIVLNGQCGVSFSIALLIRKSGQIAF